MDKVENNIRVQRTRIYSQFGKIIEEGSEKEEITLPLFDKEIPVCTISVDCSLTKNLGNYNSAKVGIFCSVPCYLDEEEMQNAAKFAKNFCEETITPFLEEFSQYIAKKYPNLSKNLS